MKRKWKWLLPVLVLGILCIALIPGVMGSDETSYPQLIAHAGGAVYGYRLTNSMEAIAQAYDNGFRYIELDFDVTADGYVVLIHGWQSLVKRLLNLEGQLSLAEFEGTDTFLNLTLLSLEDLLVWLEEHPDVSIITDVKSEDNTAVLEQIASQAGDQIGQFIPQVYDYEEYDRVQGLGYSRIILTLYRMNVDTASLQEFAQNHELWAVTMDQSRVSEELLRAVASTGTAVYAHTVNDLSFFETWREMGLTGIYTDYFQPNHWPHFE